MAPLFRKEVALTTRKPKDGEEQGKTYYFVSEDFFMSLVADNKMKEWGKNESNGCLYGTLSADYDGVPVSDELKKVYASSIPYTSRPKRDGEVDGDKYHFITEDEFRAGIKQGEFLEHGELCGVLYGTKKLDNKSKLAPAELQQVYQKTVPYTTRAKRDGEVEGKNYFFVSEAEFRASIAKGEFIEWGENNGTLYGTKKPGEEVREIDFGFADMSTADLSEVELKAADNSVTIPINSPPGFSTPPGQQAVAPVTKGDGAARRHLDYQDRTSSSTDMPLDLLQQSSKTDVPVPLSMQMSPSKWTTTL